MSLRTIDSADLKKILEAHAEWVREYRDEGEAEFSDPRRANLQEVDLRDEDLVDQIRRANLYGANLYGANLYGANLVRANLVRANLVRANLDRANLDGANLYGANLDRANLDGANLVRANLDGAKIENSTTLSDGVEWETYLRDVVPALCTAGGVELEVVAQAWDCHSWSNCPMHAAFNVNSIEEVPPLYRGQARLFVQLFDANLIPRPEPREDAAPPLATT
jgi:uncharacterized protein YjbI with pentapeptide repeats